MIFFLLAFAIFVGISTITSLCGRFDKVAIDSPFLFRFSLFLSFVLYISYRQDIFPSCLPWT